jgi:hypothetical protein
VAMMKQHFVKVKPFAQYNYKRSFALLCFERSLGSEDFVALNEKYFLAESEMRF